MWICCCFSNAVRNCGTAASFVIVVSLFYLLLRDVGCFFVTQSHSIKVSRWPALVIFSFFSSPVVLPRDPCFVGLIAAFDWVFSIFKFMFEEFVGVIFQSFSWSPDRSVDPVSCAHFRVPISSLSQPSYRLVTWRFSVPISISFFVSLVPASNLCVCHLFQSIFSASLYVFNPVFFFNQCDINLFVGIVFK